MLDEVGHPATDYPRDVDVGLDDSIQGQSDWGDWVLLSDDRRTLRFRLRVHGRKAAKQTDFLDQFRILVEAAPEKIAK